MPFCPSCTAPVPAGNAFCGRCGARLDETQTAVPQPPAPGTLLAQRYRIVNVLGRGGMGEVYRADDLLLGQTVALKFLPPAAGEASLNRLKNEVSTARQVSHPNVCRVYDIGEAGGLTYLSMEYVDGEDLRSLLHRIGKLPHDKALEVARKICAGLAAAHDKGVIHRDLKPANIMLDGQGEVRITDFGLAGFAFEETDVCSGTPAYMAPEQQAGKEVTARSDIYALGVVLHEIFTGQHPSGGSQPELDAGVNRVIQQCLDPDPQRRPDTALAVLAALPGAVRPRAERITNKILVVEDEPGIAFSLENDLRTEGYEVSVAGDGVEALRRARAEPFDLILLDVMLPNKDGFEVCRELRRGGFTTPIIMLTAKAQEAEKILGLELGADDYVTKPFSPRELRARIRAAFRRTAPEPGEEIFRFGNCELDLGRFELRREGRRLEATAVELKLLAVLLRNRGRVVARERLLEQVWGCGVHVSDRMVNNHVASLRKKIEDDPAAPRLLVSLRGVGYRFDG